MSIYSAKRGIVALSGSVRSEGFGTFYQAQVTHQSHSQFRTPRANPKITQNMPPRPNHTILRHFHTILTSLIPINYRNTIFSTRESATNRCCGGLGFLSKIRP